MSRKEKKAQKELEKAQAKLEKAQAKAEKKGGKGKVIGGVIAVVAVLAIIGGAMGGGGGTSSEPPEVNVDDYPPYIGLNALDESQPAENLNALVETADYALNNAYSQAYIKERLTDKGYTEEQINYAFDTLDCQWNTVAADAAEREATDEHMSPIEVSIYLEDKGFTEEQVDYVYNEVKTIDYNENAYQRFVELTEDDEMSPDAAVEELFDKGFTEDQVAYAVLNAGA